MNKLKFKRLWVFPKFNSFLVEPQIAFLFYIYIFPIPPTKIQGISGMAVFRQSLIAIISCFYWHAFTNNHAPRARYDFTSDTTRFPNDSIAVALGKGSFICPTLTTWRMLHFQFPVLLLSSLNYLWTASSFSQSGAPATQGSRLSHSRAWLEYRSRSVFSFFSADFRAKERLVAV